jgi:ABC-type lipoprotein release transport system permease subunit
MRTALTMLGIIIGVGAVISTVAIGEGASNQVQEQIRNLGDNMIFIQAGSVTQNGVRLGNQATKTLTVADAQAIQQQIPLIKDVSPGVGAPHGSHRSRQGYESHALPRCGRVRAEFQGPSVRRYRLCHHES